ncbi:MAG: FG-GAP-like repeat-containing protein [Nitrosomonas sp.]|nr:FG-GAP-like repeat-containing protein [Nitrosomonas sp.]
MTQVFDLTTLNGSNGFKVNGFSTVRNAGDMNGDGYDDLVSGSSVIFGKNTPFSATIDPSILNGKNGFSIKPDLPNPYGNGPGAAIGDFNGDGFDDLILPSTTFSNDSASIFFGKGTGFKSIESLNDGGVNVRALQNANYDVNIAAMNAGDINGDGMNDIILSSTAGYGPHLSKVIFGQSSFVNDTIQIGSNGTKGFTLQATDDEFTSDGFGSLARGTGDINNDGYDDLIVGSGISVSYDASNNKLVSAGSAYVVFGKASGMSGKFLMTSLDGTNGFRLDGINEYDFAGYEVSNAGDVNDDGFSDVLIGAPGTDINGNKSGSSYVVFGKASGFDAVVNLANLDGTNGFAMNGLAGDELGSSVSNAGDVNGDGFGDILIGARGADNHGVDSGSVYVIFGKSTGFSATLDLANLASDAGFRVDGLHAGDQLTSFSAAGDINKDGFDDFTVANSVIFGRSDFFSNPEKVIKGTNKSDMLVGTKAAERFEAGNGNDTLIGKGGADTYLAGNGNDYIRVSDLNFKLVDGGNGNSDTLAIAAVDANLDLTNFSGKIKGIEKISLYGASGSDNGVTLNATQLKALSDTTNKLIVNGNHGDYVHITDSGWQDKGIYNGMHTYTNADVQLVVGVNVMVDFV